MWTWAKQRSWQRWVCVHLVLLCPVQATAGAWTLAEGVGQSILTMSYQVTPGAALISRQPSREELTTQVYLEYGLFDDLTLGLTTYGEYETLTGATDTRWGLHVRHRIWQGDDGSVVSAQFGGEVSISEYIGFPTPTESVTEIDARALYGTGWQMDWANSYISTEFGYRARLGGEADELRFDATAGLEPWDGVLGLFTIAAAAPLGAGDGKLEITPSVAFTLWPRVGPNDKKPDLTNRPPVLQIGVGIDTMNIDQGLRISAGLWRWF